MSASQPYKNRLVDVLAFQPQDVEGRPVTQALALPNQGGYIATGARKLAQRWLLEFLTEQGSIPFLTERGSTFLTAAKQGRLINEAAVLREFNIATQQVMTQLHLEERDTDPDDEKLVKATLSAMSIADGYLTLKVTLTTQAGDHPPLIVPIPLAL